MTTNNYDIAVKVAPRYLYDAARGEKTFTIRKADRPYAVGKILRAYIPDFNEIFCDFHITYLLKASDFPQGIKKGYCILGISPISPVEHRRAVMLACQPLIKINILLDFPCENKKYTERPNNTRACYVLSSQWLEKMRKIHNLTSGKGATNDDV